MRPGKYLFCVLAAVLLTALPAQAAEGEDGLDRSYIQLELIQDGYMAEGSPDDYGIQTLDSAQEEQLYRRLYQGLLEKQTRIDVYDIGFPFTESGKTAFREIYSSVVNDHPELYYVTNGFNSEGYTNGSYLVVIPTYNDLLDTDSAQFEDAVTEALTVVDESMSDLEKALALHDYLALHVAYNHASLAYGDPAFSAYGALVDGSAVCQGYSLAYKLLLDQCGITCVTVSSNDLNHMWNAVQLDGDPNWYYVDVTWDDPVYDKYGRCTHDNFLLSEQGLISTGHVATGDWSFNPAQDGSTRYESGWAFNGVDTALYFWDGSYYYIRTERKVEDDNTYLTGSSLYRSATLDLSDKEEETVYWFGGTNMGIVSALWAEDKVYGLEYFNQKVVCVELGSQTAQTVWTGDQGEYAYHYGLRYCAQTDEIQIWSDLSRIDGSRSLIGSFAAKHYPLEWDQASGSATALAGARWTDGSTLQIGVVCAAAEARPTLWAAVYENGRMTGVNRVDTSKLTDGLNLLELTIPQGQEKEVRLFLLSAGSWSPCGERIALP